MAYIHYSVCIRIALASGGHLLCSSPHIVSSSLSVYINDVHTLQSEKYTYLTPSGHSLRGSKIVYYKETCTMYTVMHVSMYVRTCFSHYITQL